MAAFIIWALCGAALIGLGIYDCLSGKPVAFGFWANAAMFPVKNIKAYNKAVGKLFIVFGIVFILLGLPLLKSGQNSLAVIIPILGSMIEAIVAMAVYTTVIEKKYRDKSQ